MTTHNDPQMQTNRIVAMMETVFLLGTSLPDHWQTGLFPAIGFLLMAHLPARWLRRNLQYYSRAWWTTIALCLLPFIPWVQWDYHYTLFMAGWWFMLFLAATPPGTGRKRRELVARLKKVGRGWSKGIPIVGNPG